METDLIAQEPELSQKTSLVETFANEEKADYETQVEIENNNFNNNFKANLTRKKSWQGESAANLKTWKKINGVSLCWSNITVTVPVYENKIFNNPFNKNIKTKEILKNVSGVAPSGKIVAIIGPVNGAGKTTLLRVLSGQQEYSNGIIYYEGIQQSKHLTWLQKVNDVMGFNGNASFLAQDPVMMGSLTVRETLYYAACLKINDPSVDVNERVDNILQYLGLESCQNTKLGTVFYKGISSGEKRRVGIGVELVTQPAIVFLDEPISNLDSTSAYALMNVAHKLTLLNHSIIMTLHQPSSRIFDLLCKWDDYLIILENGSTMYNGPINQSVEFFDKCGFPLNLLTNPSDHFIDVVNRNFQESSYNSEKCHKYYIENYLTKIKDKINEINKNSKESNRIVVKTGPFFKTLLILLQRNFKNDLRNPAKFIIRLIMYNGLCFCLGTLYWNIGDSTDDEQDRISILFFVAAFLTFMSISGMPAFVEERSIFIRERINNHYGPLLYSIANFISSLPWIFLIALTSTFFIYFMIQSRLGGKHFGIYLANLFVALVCVESMMVAISALSPVFMIGLAAGAGLLGLYMILCGFFLLPKNIPDGWKWAHHSLSFHTYSFQIFMYNEFNDFKGKGNSPILGNNVLKTYGMSDVNMGFNFFILLLMTLMYRILFYTFLKLFNKKIA